MEKYLNLRKYFNSVPQFLHKLDTLKESYQNEEKSLINQREEFLSKETEHQGRQNIWDEWATYSAFNHTSYVSDIKEHLNKNLKLEWRLILPFQKLLSKRKVYEILNILEDHVDSNTQYDLIKAF